MWTQFFRRDQRRSRSTRKLAMWAESLEPRYVLDSTVVFNELMYHPPEAGDSEWVELHNQMAVDIDLSNWSISGIGYQFPDRTTIPAGGFVVVARDPASFREETGIANAFGPYSGSLDNGGERLALRNVSGREMDVLSYSDDAPWPLAPDGTGVTLAKRNPQSASEPAANWTSSLRDGGTPGRENFAKFDPTPIEHSLVGPYASWQYDDSNTAPHPQWRTTDFDDQSWAQGSSPLFAGTFPTTPLPPETKNGLGPGVQITNPSFELNSNPEPGTGPIDGWNSLGNAGISPVGDDASSFVDNGRIPDVGQVAFINGRGSISQVLSGMEVGRDYWFEIHYNARDCCRSSRPVLLVSLAGTVLIPQTEVTPVGDAEPFHVATIPFTASAEAGQLLIRNLGTTGDHTLLIDAISIIPRSADEVPVTNGSFEATGNITGDPNAPMEGPVAGWQYAGAGQIGVASAGNAVVDNGTLLDGRSAVYLQGSGSISQTIDPLTPGQRYELRYVANARTSGDRPRMRVSVDGQLLADRLIPSVGGEQPFEITTHQFVATSSTASLEFAQTIDNATALIDRVSIRKVDSPLVTPISLGPVAHYFRQEFEFAGDPKQTELRLRHFLDDGAVVYLNGQEVFRSNVPPGPIAHTTLATSSIADPSWSEWSTINAEWLVQGGNVLAVEVHQAQPVDPDMAFSLELAATELPVDRTVVRPSLVINEVGSTNSDSLQVELMNVGDAPLELSRFAIWIDGTSSPLPERTIQPNELYVVSTAVPGVGRPIVALRDTVGSTTIDAVRVGDNVQARDPNGTGPFQHVRQSSFGSTNQVPPREDSVVINEIMYHHPPSYGLPAVPPTYELRPLVELDGSWRYHQSAAGLAANWAAVTHPVGGSWQAGTGLLGFETGTVISPGLGTTLESGRVTHYFETEFTVTNDELQSTDQFRLRHAIDDGAVFYLNGKEFLRFNMPSGPILASTLANRSVNNAVLSEFETIPRDLIIAGTNRISVELHQSALSSSDAVFGVEVLAATATDPGSPATPFTEQDEEWIELYNRGADPVDLSSWSFDDAIDYSFAPGTLLQPNQYLVVSNNPIALRAKWPAANIVGPFDGSLSDRGEQIVLRDEMRNVVDEVRYFDRGHWSELADGQGSSLELRHTNSDNSLADAWAASVPPPADWAHYSYRAIGGEPAGLQTPSVFNELIIGLLDSGVVLLDDIRLIEDPDGQAIDRLQNGSFSNDSIGQPPATWRWIGNHEDAIVVRDPSDSTNHVLRVAATGPTEHMHNHGETTLVDNARIVAGREYELSFRAKWESGSPQLNTRFYFAQAARTTILATGDRVGTPGALNSQHVPNIGPQFDRLNHFPAVPSPDDPVTVSVRAIDTDGIGQLRLHYSVDSGPFTTVPMTAGNDHVYRGTIPPQAEGETVQFYVTGTDQRGVESYAPAGGPQSHAMYRVELPLESHSGHSFRLVMTRADISKLHQTTNVMSNGRLGATVIYNDEEIFYDVGVRLRASGYGRQGPLAGFNIEFDPGHLFRGVHRTISLDRGSVFSNGDGTGVRGVPGASSHELLIYQIANHAGGIGGMYDDVVYVDAPRAANSGLALLKMARYTDVYLDSQFEDGGDGSLFKYELIYYSTSTIDRDPESLKRAPQAVVGTDISNLGDDQEAYRFNFVPKNNYNRDDFEAIIALGKAFSLQGEALDEATQQVMDVDQWMRLFALQSLVGTADTYNMGLAHNLDLYVRPSDGKVLALPWDVDHGFFYPANSNILGRGGSNLQKVIDLPHNRRLFYKHLHDLLDSTYNPEYLTPWAQHYANVTQQDVSTFFVEYVTARSNYVRSELRRVAPEIPFEITTNGGEPFAIDDIQVVLEGTGWINVHQIVRADSNTPVVVKWLDDRRWQATLPVAAGDNPIQLRAVNYRGEIVGEDSVSITSTVTDRPLQQHLRITELMYHPPAPTAAELAIDPTFERDDFEFMELQNTSSDRSLDVSTVRLVAGPAEPFHFSTLNSTIVPPGGHMLLVNNVAAFRARYGETIPIDGVFVGNLRNSGESIRLEDELGVAILDFTYSDAAPWPVAADGRGSSLELIDPQQTPVAEMGDGNRWRASARTYGTPGSAPSLPGDFNQDGQLSADDLDLLCQADPTDPRFDVDHDGVVGFGDLQVTVEQYFGTSFGDANLDGVFNSSDFVYVFLAGQYEDQVVGNSTWATGDWNCDGEFTSADFIVAFQYGDYSNQARFSIGEIHDELFANALDDDWIDEITFQPSGASPRVRRAARATQ